MIADLLAATADAHSPRALVKAIAETLATRMAVVRVELAAPAPPAIAELAGESWRCVEVASRGGTSRTLAPGLSVVVRGALPAFCAEPEFRAALAQVIAAAARHLAVIQRVAMLSRRAHAESRSLRADLERRDDRGAMIARSPAMRAAAARVALVADHATTVLITGESGSGKEVVAREIHRRSPRASGPMIQLNCGAIPEALVESELFGHERGAFTGAERTRAGVFERAHGGTLLLDEVGELPPAAQVKLLRVLQDRAVRRVGGDVEIAVDVRLIAATHRSLAAMVERGTFRADLFYRLDVFAIAVPPLRERRGDLAPLVAGLLVELSAPLPPPVPSARMLARLEAHAWPGNVRELRNVLETALVLGGGTSLELPDDLPRPGSTRASRFDASVRSTIEDALRATRGKIYGVDGAAARLGLKPATLQSKMVKLGIARRAFTA